MKEITTQDIFTLINAIDCGGYQISTSDSVSGLMDQKCLTYGLLFEIAPDGKCIRIYAKEPGKYYFDN